MNCGTDKKKMASRNKSNLFGQVARSQTSLAVEPQSKLRQDSAFKLASQQMLAFD